MYTFGLTQDGMKKNEGKFTQKRKNAEGVEEKTDLGFEAIGVHKPSDDKTGDFTGRHEEAVEHKADTSGNMEGMNHYGNEINDLQNTVKTEVSTELMPRSTLLAKQMEDWKYILQHTNGRYKQMMENVKDTIDEERTTLLQKEQERLDPYAYITEEIGKISEDAGKKGVPAAPAGFNADFKDGPDVAKLSTKDFDDMKLEHLEPDALKGEAKILKGREYTKGGWTGAWQSAGKAVGNLGKAVGSLFGVK